MSRARARASDPVISIELEAAAVRALKSEWKSINDQFFHDALKTPQLALCDTTATVGYWERTSRTIAISRNAVFALPWPAIIETLKHETAHQYVDEVLGVADETAHGPAFRRVCRRWGFDAKRALSSHRAPSPDQSDPSEKKVFEKIAHCLALAGSVNLNEAELAMTTARRLMLKYNVSRQEQGSADDYSFCHLGEPTGRVQESQRILARILGEFFFVETIWIPVYRVREKKRGQVLEICGRRHNLEIASYVHSFLNETAVRLWRDYQQSHAIKSNKNRLKFHAGVMSGFFFKMDSQSQNDQQAGLVWVKEAPLADYFKSRFPAVRTVFRGSSRSSAAFATGHQAGQKVVLHKAVEPSSAGGRIGLLPGRCPSLK